MERSYITTFFGTKTAPQYTVELFRTSTFDNAKLRACFTNTRSYINGIEEEVREWLRENKGGDRGSRWIVFKEMCNLFLGKTNKHLMEVLIRWSLKYLVIRRA